MAAKLRLARGAFGVLLATALLCIVCALAAPVSAHALDDGVYLVDAQVVRAASDGASIADAAVEKPLTLIVSKAKSYLRIGIRPVTTAGLTGYLGFFGYCRSYDGEGVPKDSDFAAVMPQSYYEVADAFNASSGSDAAMAGMKYPKSAVLEVVPDCSELWIQVYVPLVEGLSAGGGTQRARLVLDYASARAVDPSEASASLAAVQSYESDMASGCGILYDRIYRASMLLLQKDAYTSASLQSLRNARDAAQVVCEAGHASGSSVASSLIGLVNAQHQLQKKSSGASESADAAAGVDTKKGPSGSQSEKSADGKSEDSKKSSASGASALDFARLSDGVYTVYGEMIKTDRKSTSVSNNAIDHSVRIRVKGGRCTVELAFKSMKLAGKTGALGRLWYFKTGYRKDSSGAPQGAYGRGKVLSYLSLGDGGTYPGKVSFPLISEARADGWVPLRVYVPIIESISKGAGVQEVYLRLHKSTLVGGEKTVSAATTTTGKATENADVAAAARKSVGAKGDGESAVDELLDDSGSGDDSEPAQAESTKAKSASAGSASAGSGTAETMAADENREPPLRRYTGLIIGIPALIVFLYCVYVLFTRRGKARALGRSRP